MFNYTAWYCARYHRYLIHIAMSEVGTTTINFFKKVCIKLLIDSVYLLACKTNCTKQGISFRAPDY